MSNRKLSYPLPRKTEMHTSVPYKSAKVLRKTVQESADSEESNASEILGFSNYDYIYVPSCMMNSFIDRAILPKQAAKLIFQKFKDRLIDSTPCSVESKLSRIMSERYGNDARTYNKGETPLSPNETMIVKLGIQHPFFPGFNSLNWSSLYSSAACEHAESQNLVSCQLNALERAKTLGMMRYASVSTFEELSESDKFRSKVSIAAHVSRTDNKKYCKLAYSIYPN